MVKCVDCGLLCVRDEYSDQTKEATELARTKGRDQSSSGNQTAAKFLCYAGCQVFDDIKKTFRSLKTDVRFSDPASSGVELLASLVECEVDCNRFTPWIEGRTPKEHEDMNGMEHARLIYEMAHREQIAVLQKIGEFSQIRESVEMQVKTQVDAMERQMGRQIEAMESQMGRQVKAMESLRVSLMESFETKIKLIEAHRNSDTESAALIRREDEVASAQIREEDMRVAAKIRRSDFYFQVFVTVLAALLALAGSISFQYFFPVRQ